MSDIRWIHISDLHFGDQNYPASHFRDDFLEKLSELSKDTQFNYLFITGDIIHAKDSKNHEKECYQNAIEYINKIQKILNVDPKCICFVPGNHDVRRSDERSETIANLKKKYDGKAVVDSVSFEIPRGKVISLIGPNGAGKSTVMGMISRLIAKDAGVIEFGDKDLSTWKSKELAKHLAILTQHNNVQMKLTVKELVSFGRFPYSGSHLTSEDEAIINKAISYMELEAFEHRFIDELSGGQRQRAYIAMVIAQDTEYVLLDEPTNNLDIYHATNLMKTVRRLCDELGKTVILVLHEINYAAFYSDYICAFLDGKIAKFGTVEEVITKETLSNIYKVEFEIMNIDGKPLTIYY